MKMVSISEGAGRFIALGLFAFFVYQVIISANKLKKAKMAMSTNTESEERRLMPSISACFTYDLVQNSTSLAADVQATLNDARQVHHL